MPRNTRRAYRNAVDSFSAWLEGRIRDDKLLADYVTYLYEEHNKSPATIRIAVAAVNWVGRRSELGHVSGVVTAEALKAIVRIEARRIEAGEVKRRGQVNGLTWEQVDKLCETITAQGTVKSLRDSALFHFMSDCLLRVSEAVSVNVSHLHEKTLHIFRSKTDQMGDGKRLYITRVTRSVIRRYMDTADLTEQ